MDLSLPRLTAAVSRRLGGEPHGSPIDAYLENNEDSRLPRHLATRSRIAPRPSDRPGGYVSIHRPTAGTSMLLSGNSSLAALTTASSASTAPSVSSSLGQRYLGSARVLEHDHQGALQIAPLSHAVAFECPFNFLYCLLTFASFPEWFAHSLTHFKKVTPPEKNKCCFCDQEFKRADGMRSWGDKMEHTALHHQLGHKLAHAQPDFPFYKFLWDRHIIETGEYKELIGGGHSRSGASSYPSPPSSPDRIPASNSSAYTMTNAPRRDERRGQGRQARRQ